MTSGRRRFNIDDIGFPENFRHVLQLAWTEEGELKLRSTVEPELQNLFRMEGITEKNTQNDKIQEFLLNFIRKAGGMEAIRNKICRPAPTPKDQQKQAKFNPKETDSPPENTSQSPPPNKVTTPVKPLMKPRGPAPPPPIDSTLRKTPVPSPRSKVTKPSSEEPLYSNSQSLREEKPIAEVPLDVNPYSLPCNTPKEDEGTDDLQDRDIIEALCDFLSECGGIEAIKNEIKTQPSQLRSSFQSRPATISHFPRVPGNVDRSARASYVPPPKLNDDMDK